MKLYPRVSMIFTKRALCTIIYLGSLIFGMNQSVDAQQRRIDITINTRVDRFIAARMDSFQIPGVSLAILRKGEMIYAKGYGQANLEWNIPTTAQTNYLIGSVTKTFTAAAVLILWEEGRLKLDDPIGRHLTGLPDHWKPVTIRQLLNHTGGIPSNQENETAYCQFQFNRDQYTQQNVIQETACLPLEFTPGSRWEYSGRGYFLLGMLIEKISGKTFGAFLQDRIFLPLEMKATRMIDHKKIIPNRAAGYMFLNRELENSPPMNPVVEFSDGGLMSTVEDLARWDASFYSEKILKRSTIEMMWTNAQLNDGTRVPSYGMGFGLTPYKGRKRVGHNGSIPGFSSCLSRFTDEDLTVILLTNITNPKLNVGQFANEIADFYK